ncbi:uncharacterized protein LOC108594755 [Drosophila busckii]|uniref:uncharacterized protein LOC108594755 n=1 Tax=Drosophila busckii TaxID=30019 RepID=UPI00083F3218|nr:uncharacterized protein LOC108594755 [Drosophila busckii]
MSTGRHLCIILSCLQLLQVRCIQLPQSVYNAKLLQLAAKIKLEQHFETIVVYGDLSCEFDALLQQLQAPTVLLSNGSSSKDWNFNSNALLLSCELGQEQELNAHTALKLQTARRLVYMGAQQTADQVCGSYFKREQHNAALLGADFATTGNYFGCRRFEQQRHVQLNVAAADPSYVQQFANMQGLAIISEPDQLAPRSMLYIEHGAYKMIGYVADLINTFVQRYNATLKLSERYDIGKIIYYGDIETLAQLNRIDVGTTLGSSLAKTNFDYLSYPYISTSYCLMMPLPAALPYKEIFALIVEPLVLCILLLLMCLLSLLLVYAQQLSWRQLSCCNVLLNDRCLRGLLAQGFPLPANSSKELKAVCLLLCFAGLMTTTMYSAYLQSYFTEPPLEPKLRNFSDIRIAQQQVAVYHKEANNLLRSYNLHITDAQSHVRVMYDWDEFVHKRDTFDKTYSYLVAEVRWDTYEEQQKLFTQPIFYYSDICLNSFVLLSVPLRRHLPYRQLFDEHILRIQQFGLLEHWLDRNFFDMVRLGLTPLEDFSTAPEHEDSVYLRDLTTIFNFYVAANLLACFCFGLECCWARLRKRRLRSVKCWRILALSSYTERNMQ